MKMYNKSSLQLKETTYKKREVILKEESPVSLNVNSIKNAMASDGEATASVNATANSVKNPEVTITGTGTSINNDANAQRQLSDKQGEISNLAKKGGTGEVDVKYAQTVSEPKNSSTPTLEECVTFTKEEMRNFLKTI